MSTTAKLAVQDVTISDQENIICGCTSLSLAALRQRIAENPSWTFEELIAETGAGTKCTACLLDLEYHFVEAQRAPGSGPAVHHAEEEVLGWDVGSLKQRIYRWADGISPMVRFPLNNTVPVLYGPGVEEWVWITNRSMMFEGQQCAPEMHIELVMRDASGRTVKIERHNVAPETSWRYQVSAPLAAAGPALAPGQVGSGTVEIKRIPSKAGIRGTTRPQIEIVTPKAACAVHSQAFSGAGQRWFSCYYRPDFERMFLSILSGVDHKSEVGVSYPISKSGIEPTVHTVVLPPRGTVLHEVRLPSALAAAVGDEAMLLTWRAKTAHKVWAICATPNLDRFSIDHL